MRCQGVKIVLKSATNPFVPCEASATEGEYCEKHSQEVERQDAMRLLLRPDWQERLLEAPTENPEKKRRPVAKEVKTTPKAVNSEVSETEAIWAAAKQPLYQNKGSKPTTFGRFNLLGDGNARKR